MLATWKFTDIRGSHHEPPITEYAARDRSNWLPPELVALAPEVRGRPCHSKHGFQDEHMPKIARALLDLAECQCTRFLGCILFLTVNLLDRISSKGPRNSGLWIQYEVMDILIE